MRQSAHHIPLAVQAKPADATASEAAGHAGTVLPAEPSGRVESKMQQAEGASVFKSEGVKSVTASQTVGQAVSYTACCAHASLVALLYVFIIDCSSMFGVSQCPIETAHGLALLQALVQASQTTASLPCQPHVTSAVSC